MLIAEAAGNSVLSRYMGELFDSRHDPIAAAMRGHAESAQTWTAAVQEHETVLRALQAGDPIAAQTAIRAHLMASEERWISGALKPDVEEQ
jgi:GntR family transcriptional repressor for pyruvate dehydrogenase complex